MFVQHWINDELEVKRHPYIRVKQILLQFRKKYSGVRKK